MSAPAYGPDHHRPPCIGPTYEDLWTAYTQGRLSSSVMRSLLMNDRVFAQYCKRMLKTARLMRDEASREAW